MQQECSERSDAVERVAADREHLCDELRRLDRVRFDRFEVGAGERRTIRGDQGHVVPRELVLSQSEVTRAILLGDSPCCAVPAPEVLRELAVHGRSQGFVGLR